MTSGKDERERAVDSLVQRAHRVAPILKRARVSPFRLSPDEDDAIVDFCHAITRVDNAKPTILPPGTVAVERASLAGLLAEMRAVLGNRSLIDDETLLYMGGRRLERWIGLLAALAPTDAAPPAGEG